jgi:hypothetical protein
MVWEITSAGTYVDVHDFGVSVPNVEGNLHEDGAEPYAGVTFDLAGNLYGTTSSGGPNNFSNNGGDGMVWKLEKGTVVAGVAASPTNVIAGKLSTGTVTLNTPSPVGGTVVNLSYTGSRIGLPETVEIPEGQTSANFEIVTYPESAPVSSTIVATLGASTATTTLTVGPPTLESLTLRQSTVQGSSDLYIFGKLTFNGSAPFGATISVSSSNPAAAAVPSTVQLGSGGTTVSFTINHFAVTTTQVVTITATCNGVTKTAQLTVTP